MLNFSDEIKLETPFPHTRCTFYDIGETGVKQSVQLWRGTRGRARQSPAAAFQTPDSERRASSWPVSLADSLMKLPLIKHAAMAASCRGK